MIVINILYLAGFWFFFSELKLCFWRYIRWVVAIKQKKKIIVIKHLKTPRNKTTLTTTHVSDVSAK